MLFFRVRGYCNKLGKGDESLPLLAFRRHVVDAIFLEYSKEGNLSLSHEGIRNILSDICYDDTKHFSVESESTRIQNSFKHLKWSVLSKQLTA